MRGLLKDFGIFARSRLADRESFLFDKLVINSFARIGEGRYTIMAVYPYESWEFALSLDFDQPVLNEFMARMDDAMLRQVKTFLEKGDTVELGQEIEINVRAIPGKKIFQNREETYIPFEALSIRIWRPPVDL